MSGGNLLYVHLSEDAGIFIVDGTSGRQAWVMIQRRLLEGVEGSFGARISDRNKQGFRASDLADLGGYRHVAERLVVR